ncbi:MAG: hypothetical protein ACYC3Q_05905 [Gemmatimonadaceae bacterium]
MSAPWPSLAGARRASPRLAVGALLVALAACGPAEPRARELRQISPTYAFTISASDLPPHAREGILYKIVVRDRKSRQPIENGEGQLFASNRDGAQTWDGLRQGQEIGTYYAKLNYVTAGQWAVAIRFRRDSTQKLERIDWMQDVLNARDSTVSP